MKTYDRIISLYYLFSYACMHIHTIFSCLCVNIFIRVFLIPGANNFPRGLVSLCLLYLLNKLSVNAVRV